MIVDVLEVLQGLRVHGACLRRFALTAGVRNVLRLPPPLGCESCLLARQPPRGPLVARHEQRRRGSHIGQQVVEQLHEIGLAAF